MRSRMRAACSKSRRSAASSMCRASSAFTAWLLPPRKASASATSGLVGRRLDIADAGRRTALDLVQQAGPRAVGIDAVGAGAQQEGLLQRVDGAVHRTRRGEGAIVVALAVARTAMLGELRHRMVAGDEDVGKGLVVAQHHVEARLQLLDEIGFEQQCFGFGTGGDELHVAGERDHGRDAAGVVAEARVVRHAVPQVACLADIDDVALGVVHAVDAGLAGQPGHEIMNDLGAGRRLVGLAHAA